MSPRWWAPDRGGDNMRGGTAVLVALLIMAQPCRLVPLTSLGLDRLHGLGADAVRFDGAAQAGSGQQTAADRGFLLQPDARPVSCVTTSASC